MSTDLRLEFGLLENGLDFICRALEYLEGEPNKRDLKYAILHLQSGVELLFKERLRQKDWKLVFEEINHANESLLESGSFKSVYWGTCIKRLYECCGIDLSSKRQVLDTLKVKRNCIEHFRIIDTESAVKAITVAVLSVVIDFINDELQPKSMNKSCKMLFQQIQESIGNFVDFVDKRMTEIEPKLKENKGYILECPRCLQLALIIDVGAKCLFCGYKEHEEKAAHDFAEKVLEIDWKTIADGGVLPIYRCPNCGSEALVDVVDLGDISSPRFACYGCGEVWDWGGLDFCTSCGNPFPKPDDDFLMCEECFDWKIGKED